MSKKKFLKHKWQIQNVDKMSVKKWGYIYHYDYSVVKNNEICPNKIIYTKNGGQTKIFEKYNLNFYYCNHLSLLLKFTVFELLIMKFQ